MTVERSKRRSLLVLTFIAKSTSKNLLIRMMNLSVSVKSLDGFLQIFLNVLFESSENVLIPAFNAFGKKN